MSDGAGTAGHLDIGGVFAKTSDIYKEAFGTVWIVALILMIPAAIIVAILGDDGILGFIGSLINLAASAWLIGSIVRIVEDVEADGRVDKSVGELLGSVAPRLIPLIVLQLIIGIGVGIGLVLLIIPGVILALMWIAAIPAFVVEEKGIFESLSRSSELTRGNRMRILGVGIVVLAIYIAVALIGGLLVAAAPVIGVIALVITAVLLYPYISIISAVLYFRLRELQGGGVAPAVGPESIEPTA